MVVVVVLAVAGRRRRDRLRMLLLVLLLLPVIYTSWLLGLSCWDLAGVERATLAGKGLLAAARLVCEWSPALLGRLAEGAEGAAPVFGVEEAARAVSVEVDWQTKVWGEVEDTHDVEKEDVRRQFGSVVLLVSGEGVEEGRG